MNAPTEVLDQLEYSRSLNLYLYERESYDQIVRMSPFVSSLYPNPESWIALTRRCRSAQIDEVGWPMKWVCVVRTAGPLSTNLANSGTVADSTAIKSALKAPEVAPMTDTQWEAMLYMYNEAVIVSGLRDGGTVIAWRIGWEALIVNVLFWMTCGAVLSWFFRETFRSVGWRFFAQRRLKQGRCARCGYPALKSVMEPNGTEVEPQKCPECGLPVGALPGGLLGRRPIMVHR
ncbi:MAG: hypothetical protein IBJ18_02140 [Phycisphaerales bacterium]|nr:hypothetical protein [Phycisphaerales bacterium]